MARPKCTIVQRETPDLIIIWMASPWLHRTHRPCLLELHERRF